MSDVKNVRKIMNSRKTSVLLNRLRNIEIVIKLSHLRRLSKIVERYIYILRIVNREVKKVAKDYEKNY